MPLSTSPSGSRDKRELLLGRIDQEKQSVLDVLSELESKDYIRGLDVSMPTIERCFGDENLEEKIKAADHIIVLFLSVMTYLEANCDKLKLSRFWVDISVQIEILTAAKNPQVPFEFLPEESKWDAVMGASKKAKQILEYRDAMSRKKASLEAEVALQRAAQGRFAWVRDILAWLIRRDR